MAFLPGKEENLKTGFKVYAIPAPKFQELKAEGKSVHLKVPEVSAAGKDGLTDGFLVIFKTGDKPAKAFPIGFDKVGKTIDLKLSQVFPQAQPGQEVKFTAAVCEYALDKEGKRCLGPESQQLSASAVIPEPAGTKEISGVCRYICVPTTYSSEGGQISRSAMIRKRQAHIKNNIKDRQNKLAELNKIRNPDERYKYQIAQCQRAIERDRKTLRNYDDPDWVNFRCGSVLHIDWSASHKEAYKSSTSGIGFKRVEMEGGSIIGIRLKSHGYFENINPGASGRCFTGVNRKGERLSAQIPINGGKGSLSIGGKEYEIFSYDQATYDKYKELTR